MMGKKHTDNPQIISVVIPVYNEENNLKELHRRLTLVFKSLSYDYEIIYVDDGSHDCSVNVLHEINKTDSHTRFIAFSRNFGHQIAITAGMENASGNAVVVMDADLQHPPEIIPELLKKWEEGYNIVSTIREDVKDIGFIKKMTASIFYKIINKISDTDIQENAADFRLVDRQVIDTLNKMNEKGRFVRGLISWVGFNQTFIKFVADSRFSGQSKYSVRKMIGFALDGITTFSAFPLRIATHLGIMAVFIPLPYVVYAIVLRLFTNKAVPGWASILVAVVFLGGVQLITIGIIGEYISRIYEEVKGRPLYIVQEVGGFEKRTREVNV